MGGVAESNTRSNYNTPGSVRNNWVGGGIDQKCGQPNGYRGGAVFNIPIKDGSISSHCDLVAGLGAITAANLAGGLNAVGPLTGSGTISNADLALVVQAVAALTGSGTVVGDINAKLEAAAALTGSGDITAALLDALGHLVAALTGTGDAAAVVNAGGTMEAAITVTGAELNTANVAGAVWGALALLNNEAGSLGGMLNSVDDRIPAELVDGKMDSTLSPAERDLIATALLDLANSIEAGITVRKTLRVLAAGIAGKTTDFQTLSPKFRDINDTKDVISATMDSDGNRTAVTLDLS